ncbi:PaaI family thioesterase [Ktedonosporobacter rubrisoli]|nr:PaaI family thioesterase [Ktedonosporobacter rubrisoli]
MDLAVTKQELQHLLSEVAFTRQYGFVVHTIADGVCSLNVPFQALFERPGGIVSGQVFMAAADVAMWLAIMTKLGLRDQSVTVEMKTNFLQGVRQEPFLCTATILKPGKRLIYGVAECMSTHGTLLTHHTITYMRLES